MLNCVSGAAEERQVSQIVVVGSLPLAVTGFSHVPSDSELQSAGKHALGIVGKAHSFNGHFSSIALIHFCRATCMPSRKAKAEGNDASAKPPCAVISSAFE